MASDPEGEANARRFEGVMSRVLKVSKAELTKREAAYQKHRKSKRRQPRATGTHR